MNNKWQKELATTGDIQIKMKCFFSLSFLAKSMTNITEFIDFELGMAQEEESEWGLFIILDEEDTMVTHRRQTLLKNIVRIATIYEDANEDPEPEFSNGAYANEATCPDSIYGKMDYYNTANWIPETTNQQDCDSDGDQDQDQDYDETIQSKMQFLVTYALTTSFSIALIILTFTI